MTLPYQPGILAAPTPRGRHLFFRLAAQRGARDALLAAIARIASSLGEATLGTDCVVGLGASLVSALGASLPHLHDLATSTGVGVSSPGTPCALWVWLRGEDPGVLLHRGRAIESALAGVFERLETTDTFIHDGGRDLTGYVDGTENPEGDEAVEAAFQADGGAGLDGSSYVAIQRWVHALSAFEALDEATRDASIGRRRTDDVELEDAPESAHVKRTAQESFAPEAFVLRRSQPWIEGDRAGLLFVAFGRSLDAFEAQLRRMLGLEDGVVDALFRFTRPETGMSFWCPPLVDGALDLRALARSGVA